MRRKMFLLCCALSSLVVCCLLAKTAYGQQITFSAAGLPELLREVYISIPYKKILPLDKEVLTQTMALPIGLRLSDLVTSANSTINPNVTDSTADGADDVDTEADPLIIRYAEMISAEPREINNFMLYQFIDGWYGTRYKWGGTDSRGIDCSAFSQRLYDDVFCTPILRNSRQQYRSCEHIDEEEAAEGDLVFFRMRRLRVSHVGVYLANGYFVHASRSHGVTISNLNNRYWQRRLAGYGRMERPEAARESALLQ